MKYVLLTLALTVIAAPALAAGDAEAGGKLFSKTCGGCHSIGEGARHHWPACRYHHGLPVFGCDEELGRGVDAGKTGGLH